jgi:hypothetical protein
VVPENDAQYRGDWKLVSSKLSGLADMAASAVRVILLKVTAGRESVIVIGLIT